MAAFHPTTHPNYIPDYMAASVRSISYKHLWEQGVRCIAFDADSTLVAHGGIELNAETIQYLRDEREKGYIADIIIATNRKKRNLDALAQALSAKAVIHGHGIVRKPSQAFYSDLIQQSGYKPEQIAMVGDKLLQDVFGANRAGLVSILVEPLGPPAWFDALLLHRWRQERITKNFTHVQRF